MFSTQKNIVLEPPSTDTVSVCKRYLQYPFQNYSRQGEGGLRLLGKYKQGWQKKPLVSVITVVYNREVKIERAILSVLQQTYDNIEFIVIDGASSDQTLSIIKKYEDAVDYYVSEPDGGIYPAMNKGLSLASGDYIGILNSDDWYNIDAIQQSVNQILEKKADFSYGKAVVVDQGENPIGVHDTKFMDERAFFELSPCNHGTMFISREAYNSIGQYDNQYKIAADFDMQLKLIAHNFQSVEVDQPLYYYELEGASAAQQELSMKNMCDILQKYHHGCSTKELMQLVLLRWKDMYNEENMLEILQKFVPELMHTSVKKEALIQWLLKNFEQKREVVPLQDVTKNRNYKWFIKMFLPYGVVRFLQKKGRFL